MIPPKTIEDLIAKHSILEKDLSSSDLNKNQFAEKSNVSYEVQDKLKIKLDIPPWIKSNAKWWSNDAITTSEFLTAIEFLINQRILIIPDTTPSQSESMTGEVPSWVKNNALWWANDVISDSDFVSAIQYLISQGIIQIDPSEVNTTTIIVE